MQRIYIVDDDESPRRGLVRLLCAAGYDARGFASGVELLALSNDELSGMCLITDIRMVAMTPREIHGALRRRGLSPAVIIITADNQPESHEVALEIGASAFFTKPVDGSALIDTIAWVGRRTDGSAHPQTVSHVSINEHRHGA
jgi:FixJ family two-component response regulator